MSELLSLRRRMMPAGGGGLYDAEIEYLESDGSQYIMTGVNGNSVMECDAKAQFLSTSTQCLLGSRSSTRHGCRLFGIWSDGRLYCNVGDAYVNVSFSSATNTDLHILKTTSGNNSQRLYVDGSAGSAASSNGGRVSNEQLAMFALNYPDFGEIIDYATARIYYLKITVGGNLVRDFIPVRKGTVGFMYDKVSQQLFGNRGTGTFTLGPDIV